MPPRPLAAVTSPVPLLRPLAGHDHSQCVRQALDAADGLCERRGARLTPLRRRVLELVWASHKPLGAYELLDQLAREGHKPAPPTIYRALDFLLEHALIHRLASLNAYLGCNHPGERHAGQFLICLGCGTVEELDDPAVLREGIAEITAAAGFQVQQGTLELAGLCQQCRHD